MQYYYVDEGGDTVGPVDEKALRTMLEKGEVSDATEVAEVGASTWTTCGEALSAKRELKVPPPPPEASGGSSALLPPSQLAGVEKGVVAKVPKISARGPLRCHEIDYELFGDDLQVVEVVLGPGETVIAEAGAMNYMESGVTFEAKMGDGSKPVQGFFGKVLDVGKRALTGESLFMTHFTNEGAGKQRVAFAAPYPGKIVCLNMADLGEEVLCQKDAFLCAAYGTEVTIAFQKKLGVGFFGGEGFILQKLIGDGMAFAHAGGTVVKKELRGETLRVDTGCVVAFTKGVEYDIERTVGLKSMFFGGEGLFLATLRGHGTVWIQSLPFSRLADRILQNAPSAGGSSKGEGSVLGGLGRMLDGD